MFCSLLFGVFTDPSRSVRKQTCTVTVIHYLLHGRPSVVDCALQYRSIARYSSRLQNRNFCLPHLHSTSCSRRTIAMTFGTEKLEWSGYPMVTINTRPPALLCCSASQTSARQVRVSKQRTNKQNSAVA